MARKSAQPVNGASQKSGSKSTALGPMIWLVGLLLAAVTANSFAGPEWLQITLVAFLGVAVAVFLWMFIHFGRNDPDLLRSERYNIQKLQMGKIGDDKHGFGERANMVADGQLEVKPTPSIEQSQSGEQSQ